MQSGPADLRHAQTAAQLSTHAPATRHARCIPDRPRHVLEAQQHAVQQTRHVGFHCRAVDLQDGRWPEEEGMQGERPSCGSTNKG